MNDKKQIEFEKRINCGVAYCEDTAIKEIKQDFKMQEEKNKQIEEMQKNLEMAMCEELPFIDICEMGATALYNAGYRKIPKNAVVLTTEELNEKQDIAWNRGKKQARKATAKEILQDLYSEATSNISETVELTTFQIEQLAKRYGVNLGE